LKFSILITTYNRLSELKITLQSLKPLFYDNVVEFIICIDGSTDNTYEYLKENYPNIKLLHHKKSKGLIASRNELLQLTNADYAISLDDDANFLSTDILKNIEKVFEEYPDCAVQAFSVFWGLNPPDNILNYEKVIRVNQFVGCGHVWNMKAWNSIPNYPEWFIFYGEESFASFQVFKNGMHIYYNPSVLVHHRVSVKNRVFDKDYQVRTRRSLRSGWYLYFLFYPLKLIPRKFAYTLWMQLKNKVFKGDLRATIGVIRALLDVLINLPRLIVNRNRLTLEEFEEFGKLPKLKIYWQPKKI